MPTMKLEVKLVVEIDHRDMNKHNEQRIADDVRNQLQEALENFDYCDTCEGPADLDFTILYVDDYEE